MKMYKRKRSGNQWNNSAMLKVQTVEKLIKSIAER